MTAMNRDPYFIEGPALISFSGGRTSGYMLRQILDRGLEPDVHVLFCNTGKEDDRTLDFVRDCAVNWNVRIRWLQYRRRYLPEYRSEEVAAAAARLRAHFGFEFGPPPGDQRDEEPGFVEVSYETAARTNDPPSVHHPFTNLVMLSGVPNAATRLCSTEMKTRVMKRFMLANGYDEWWNVVGMRADEPKRVKKLLQKPPERWENLAPLAEAGVTEAEVLRFWREQPFDLQLPHDPELGTYLGNCDLCMLKRPEKKVRVVQENAASLGWWEQVEEASGSFFRPSTPYRKIRHLSVVPDDSAIRAADPVYAAADALALVDAEDLAGCMCHD